MPREFITKMDVFCENGTLVTPKPRAANDEWEMYK
jgi:hypothetical protein